MEGFINGIGIISPQKTFDTPDFLSEVVEHNSKALYSFEPSYKEFLNPNLARRMARIIKMGIAASTICFKDAKIEMPDAIMTGTALEIFRYLPNFLMLFQS